jgi:hypothetical protein
MSAPESVPTRPPAADPTPGTTDTRDAAPPPAPVAGRLRPFLDALMRALAAVCL